MNYLTHLSMILLLMTGCGSGGTSSPPISNAANGTDSWCDLPYYHNIIGIYSGKIGHQLISTENGAEVRNCEWDTRLTITGTPIVNKCFLEMQLSAIPTQLYVPDSSDPGVHQCRGDDNRIYGIDDPNQNAGDLNILVNVGFPVLLKPTGHEFDPIREPYFGDQNVLAFQIYLLAGGVPIADQLLVDEMGFLDFIDNNPNTILTTSFQSRLIKEITQ